MLDVSALASKQQDLIGSTCAVCQQGTLQRGRSFFPWTNVQVCPTCSTEFLRAGDKFVLRKIPVTYERWLSFDGQALSHEEMQRISGGGKSDAEIAAAKAASDAEIAAAKAASDAEKASRAESLRQSQIEGTPEYYFARKRKILGLSSDGTENEFFFEAHSKDELKQQIARLKQMQKELKVLKKEVNQQIKQKKLEVALGGYKRDASANLKRLVAAPYEIVIESINSMIVQLDGIKLKLENPQLVTGATTKVPETVSNKKSKSDLQEEAGKASEDLKTLLAELDAFVGLEFREERSAATS